MHYEHYDFSSIYCSLYIMSACLSCALDLLSIGVSRTFEQLFDVTVNVELQGS